MLIITMQRLTMDGESVEYNTADENGDDYTDWFCVIETKEEELVYDKACAEGEHAFYETLWDAMVNYAGQGMGIKWGDDDMYGYIRPDEAYPELLEKYTDPDGDVWLRKE